MCGPSTTDHTSWQCSGEGHGDLHSVPYDQQVLYIGAPDRWAQHAVMHRDDSYSCAHSGWELFY
jgi:hypothetical protein